MGKIIIDGNEFSDFEKYETSFENGYIKEPKRRDFLAKAKCSNCGEIEYSFRDIENETIGNIFIEYIICPKCKNKIVIKEMDLSVPYVDSESALHCLTCGEVLTKRIDKIDGFSWLFCKNCVERSKNDRETAL